MLKITVQVRYKRDEGPSTDLDDEIKKLFEDLGFKFTGQGFTYADGVRDIQFEKEQKD